MSFKDVQVSLQDSSTQNSPIAGRKIVPGWLAPGFFCFFLVCLLFLPFVNKAFHIDDYYFLVWGELFDWNPLIAIPRDFMHQGLFIKEALPYDLTHPLLVPYLLKVLQEIFGRNEWPLHLVFLFFPLLALLSLAKLLVLTGYEYKLKVLVTLALFGTLPAFVVNGQNLMSDVPTLAFLLAGVASVVEAATSQRIELVWKGAGWLTCAVFTSYQALCFVVLLMAFVLFVSQSRRQKFYSVVILLIPLMLMLGWLLLIYLDYGTFPGQRASGVGSELIRGSQSHVIWARTVFVFAMIGASLIFVLPLRLAAGRKPLSPVRLGAVSSAIGFIFFLVAPAEAGDGMGRTALALLCLIGTVGLGLAYVDLKNWYRTSNRPLVLFYGGWLVATLLCNLLLLPFGNARYLLPIFPVLFLVILKDCDYSSTLMTRFAVVLTIFSMLWGLGNAWADSSYAGAYRDMAGEVAEFRDSLKSEQQIWYVGEWGMRHYFDRAGAHYLPANSIEPRPGDYVVIPEMPRFWAPAPWLRPRLTFYARREFRSPLPLRLFNRRSGAGFYCHYWGMLPFAFSLEPDEVFVIQEVR